MKIETIRVLELDTNHLKRTIHSLVNIKNTEQGQKKDDIDSNKTDTVKSKHLLLIDNKNSNPVINSDTEWFFYDFIYSVDVKPFTILLSTKKRQTHVMFLKKTISDTSTEYVLMTNTNVIQIIGNVDIKTVSDLQKIVSELSEMEF